MNGSAKGEGDTRRQLEANYPRGFDVHTQPRAPHTDPQSAPFLRAPTQYVGWKDRVIPVQRHKINQIILGATETNANQVKGACGNDTQRNHQYYKLLSQSTERTKQSIT